MTDQKLCDRFTKQSGKRGKPARDAVCAVCETVWVEHYAEKAPQRGPMRPVLHPERVREMPEPKRKRPKAITVKMAIREEATATIEMAGQFVEPEPEPEEPDLMGCGHPLDKLAERDGEEYCTGCESRARFAAWSESWFRQNREREVGRKMTDQEWDEYYEWLCDW